MNVNLPLGDRLNLPDLVSKAIPPEKRKKGTNVAILEDNWTSPTTGMNHNDPGFLSDSFPRNPPRLYITAESQSFDHQTLTDWIAEGFHVEYLPFDEDEDTAHYLDKLRRLHRKGLGPCETFGIIAFGEAASVCLEHYHVLDNNIEMKLGVLVAYYPSRIPDPATRFPSSVRVLVHLATGEVGIVKQSQMVGIQGKKRVTKGNVDRGTGVGGTLAMGYQGYAYDVEEGFAEHDLDEYDGICAELAWSRSLAVVRKALRPGGGNCEGIAEINTHGKFYSRDVQQTMATYTTDKIPHVTYMPTLSGGAGTDALEDFYTDYFVNSNPPSLELTLLSRTVGVDRVVDEMYVSFQHTQEMPWILPGVPPTNKRVEITMVSIVAVKGGKLYSEHVYWDQASVLVQVGLLNPKLVPQAAQDKGVERLPVVGRKAARRVFGCGNEEGEADNRLIDAAEGVEEHEKESHRGDNGSTNGAGSEKSLATRPKETREESHAESSKQGSVSNGHKEDEPQGDETEDNHQSRTKHATVEDAMSGAN
ncbi:hypothetical protein QBC47DRAFT_387138 [Echria macrotheca]|uniref:Dienelactone hydrolase n=1 Tax=Echria macrotheca TaxID=438768 RepID=A0AAJ0B8S3_9PEZI|nr:hypothetical protein QBC47DRAFT_387138 [Echria macrotheca]